MKKRALVLLLCGCFVLSGCNDTGNNSGEKDITPTAGEQEQITNVPETTPSGTEAEGMYWNPSGQVTLGTYLGVEVEKIEATVSDEELQSEIDYFLYNNSEYVDVTDHEEIREGDCVDIDYKLVSGEATVEEEEGYIIEIGNGEFEFEDALLGLKAGEETTYETTMDEVLYEEYAGKSGAYTVKVNGIKKLEQPELTDETVAAYTDYKTVEEYRQNVYDSLLEEAQARAEEEQYKKMFDRVIETSVFAELNAADAQSYVDETVDYYSYYASMWGIEVSELTQLYFGLDYEQFIEQVQQEAEFVVKQYLILDEVIRLEKLEVSEQEYQDSLSQYAATYGYDTAEEAEEMLGKEEIMQSLLRDKAYQVMIDAMIVK